MGPAVRGEVAARVGAGGGAILWFPVRHHSPTAARLLRDLIERERPAAVLIEGPSDANDHIGELGLDHTLPISLYCWAVVRDDEADDDVAAGRRGAFYPLCTYSPEWQAVRTGLAVGTEVAFIDLPWADLAAASTVANRWSDHELTASTFAASLCDRLGVDGFDGAWDLLMEIDPAIDLATYLRRAEVLGQGLRPPNPDDVDAAEHAREACMAREVLGALRRHPDRPVVVVTGAFHTDAVRRLVEAGGPPDDVGVPTPRRAGDGRGVALTPTTYEALDALTGYDAGQPNPGFYDRLWHDRNAGTSATASALLFDIARAVRRSGRFVSPADLIAVATTAQGLAALRGHQEVWRTDLLDGITAALVKDELTAGGGHPLLAAAHATLRGGAIGRLADGTTLPPLVVEAKRRLSEDDLTPLSRAREVLVDLGDDDGLRRSRLLHALEVLRVPGAMLLAAVQLGLGGGRAAADLTERWRLQWVPAHEAALVEAAAYGSTVSEAVSARLLERAAGLERDAVAATALLVQAALAGMEQLTEPLQERAAELLATEPDLGAAGEALGTLLRLYRYDPVLRSTGRADLGALTSQAYERGLRLLERVGRVGSGEGEDRAVAAVAALVDASERCGADLGLPPDGLDQVLGAVAADQQQAPAVRGAAYGGRWVLGHAGDDDLLAGVIAASDPDELGDHLTGLFTLAREVATRRPEVVAAIDAAVAEWDEAGFLAAVPSLRRAFTAFTPREKHHLTRGLFGAGEEGGSDDTELAVPVEEAVALLAIEAEVVATRRRFGLRGVDDGGAT